MEFIILVAVFLVALGTEKVPEKRKVAVARNRIHRHVKRSDARKVA